MRTEPPSDAVPALVRIKRPATKAERAILAQLNGTSVDALGCLLMLGVLVLPLGFIFSQTYAAGMTAVTSIISVPLIMCLLGIVYALITLIFRVIAPFRKPNVQVEEWNLIIRRAWWFDLIDLEGKERDTPTVRPGPGSPTTLGPDLPWYLMLLELADGQLISVRNAPWQNARTSDMQISSNCLKIVRTVETPLHHEILSVTPNPSTNDEPTTPVTPGILWRPRFYQWNTFGPTIHQPEDLPLWILQAINRVPNPDAPSTMPQ